MKNSIYIAVSDRMATCPFPETYIVCGNGDYEIVFSFDNVWSAHVKKTARFIWNNQYIDVEFTGDTVEVPILSNTTLLKVGVYAGDLISSSPAEIKCIPSIICEHGVVAYGSN